VIPKLKPWADGPFEVLLHAEMHYRVGEDFDRRIAMIGFDNAIEVAITTYLSLHPMQRGNRQYPNAAVEQWLNNYHTKLSFFFVECTSRNILPKSKQDEVIYYHDVRNRQYHVGGAEVPQERVLDDAREAAIEVFGVLFDQPDVNGLLEVYVAHREKKPSPRTSESDKLIDEAHGVIELCGQLEYSSEVLYALDPDRYHAAAEAAKTRETGEATDE
jgi:hypothetical protein